MEIIRIGVNKQIDGYTFSIGPTVRRMIKSWFPDSHPANNIFVSYDTRSDFELQIGKLEPHIYPVLLGLECQKDLIKKVHEIQFIDTRTGKILHIFKLTA